MKDGESVGVDTELAAAAFVTGMKTQELGLDGKESLQMFVGCVQEIRPESRNYEDSKKIATSLVEARQKITGVKGGSGGSAS